MSYNNDYSYRAYSPDVNASPRRGNAPIRPEERRGVSMPVSADQQQQHGYPPYPAGNGGVDYQRLSLLDDHGDTVRVGLNGPASSTPNLGYNQPSGYPAPPYGNAPIAPSPYGASSPAPSYGSSLNPYGAPATSAHRTASSPASSTHSLSNPYPSSSYQVVPQTTQRRPQPVVYPSDDDPLAFGSNDRHNRSRSKRRSPSPSRSRSTSPSPVRSRGAPAPGGGNPTNLADFIPASFNAGNAVQAASTLASFFSNSGGKPTTAPEQSHPPAQSGFNMQGVYDYIGNAAAKASQGTPATGGSSGSSPHLNVGGFSIDKDWIMNFISTTNPLVLIGIVVVAFLVISQIIATVIKFAVIGAIIYGAVLFIMKNNAENGGAASAGSGRGSSSRTSGRTSAGGGARKPPKW